METATPTRRARNRTVHFEWVVEQKDEVTAVIAQLSCSHDKDRKHFYATLHQVTREERPTGFTATSFSIFDGLSIQRDEVARFSQKALDRFADEVLANVDRMRADGNEEVESYFTPGGRDR